MNTSYNINDLEMFHFQCLQGTYFNVFRRSGNHILLFSDYIKDSYYNYLAPSQGTTIEDCLAEEPEFARRSRNIAVYVTPTASPELRADLTRASFSPWATDRWFTSEVNELAEESLLPRLRFCSVIRADTEKRTDYLNVFRCSYSGVGEDEAYGPLDEGYLNALDRSFEREDGEYKCTYLLSYFDDEPVGLAQMFTRDYIAGVYGVGVVPGARRKGIGRAIMSELARRARDQGVSLIFLQTEADSSNDYWYKQIGFAPVFDAHYLRRSA